MGLARITNVEELQRHLYAAMQLEHATIPAYLTALYSIHPGSNTAGVHVLRAVAVEEMLHLTLAANLMNAVGGTVDLTKPDFVPVYPASLPDGETDFQVDLGPFSKDTITTFLRIERPRRASGGRTLRRKPAAAKGRLHAARVAADSDEHFYSIGEFYEEISEALGTLGDDLAKRGKKLFVGDPAKQITPDYYYSGGGGVIPVTDLASAQAAIRLIAEQGEGIGKDMFDFQGELSHYYRFEQLLAGRYYQEGDKHGQPTGPAADVDWSAVYPIKTNARMADYPQGSELHAAAVEFSSAYKRFLGLLTRAYGGERELLITAVGDMFRIKDLFLRMMRHPMDAAGKVHAAPPFELADVRVE